jgi:hypothetical protein
MLNDLARKLLVLLTVFLAAVAGSAESQDSRRAGPLDASQQTRLRQLGEALQARLESRKTALYYELLASNDPATRRLNESPDIQLMYIADTGVPVYYAPISLTAAKTSSTDDVWPGGLGGYSLDGAGTTIELAMWDGGEVRVTHEALVGRVFNQETSTGSCLHPTWVAGILVASGGFHPDVKGMSFASNLLVWDADDDDAEMAFAAANGILLSNHSYEIPGGWRLIDGDWYWFGDLTVDPNEDYGFGFYGAKCQVWDQIAYDAPHYFIQKGCGNDRGERGPSAGESHFHWEEGTGWVSSMDVHPRDGDTGGYDTISWFGNAKNIVAVGAVRDIPNGYTQPGDVIATTFTSFGPCDDGRIKPDVVANGTAVWSSDCTSDTSYYATSGTSLSGPVVVGSANLLREHYETTFGGGPPRAATLKALIIHTADEAGPADGPDYQFGWGLMNTLSAADQITAGTGHFREATLNDGDTHRYRFSLGATADVRVTMVWTDPPGAPPAPAVDPPDPALVNDLDVRVAHWETSTSHQPWRLDGANPANPATRGDNVVDNIERIDLPGAAAGNYEVTVTHKGTLTPGLQAYSLVSTEPLGDIATGVEDTAFPVAPSLRAYPNPFNPAATISYSVPAAGTARISVFDVAGRLVATLVDRHHTPGNHQVSWSGRDTGGTPVASGAYFVRLETQTGNLTRKLVLVR